MNKKMLSWLLFIIVFFIICFWADIEIHNIFIGFLGLLLMYWAYARQKKDIIEKIIEEVKKIEKDK